MTQSQLNLRAKQLPDCVRLIATRMAAVWLAATPVHSTTFPGAGLSCVGQSGCWAALMVFRLGRISLALSSRSWLMSAKLRSLERDRGASEQGILAVRE